MLTDKAKKLATEMGNELNNILDYWINRTIDNTNGGFYGQINGNNQLVPEAHKGVILNTRILWAFSSAYRVTRNSKYKEIADRAKNYILKHFIDHEMGGVYWSLDYKGNPLETKKQIYAQSFAIYAFSEYYRIEKDENVLEEAKKLFSLIEQHSFDPTLDGYFEAYSREWKLLDDLRLSDKDANEKKTMNTHLHVLEAYTNLYRVWPNANLRKQTINLINVFTNKIIDQQKASFNLFFEEDWTLKSHETSFGHDIEGSWLLYEAAYVVGDHALLKKVEGITLKMAEEVLKNAIDTDGGIMNESRGQHGVDTDKHWWPQAEAIIGFMNAYQISNNEQYLVAAERVWDFANKFIIDHTNGEWFFRVDRNGNVYKNEDKVGFWKCPYHNSRACLEIIDQLKK